MRFTDSCLNMSDLSPTVKAPRALIIPHFCKIRHFRKKKAEAGFVYGFLLGSTDTTASPPNYRLHWQKVETGSVKIPFPARRGEASAHTGIIADYSQ